MVITVEGRTLAYEVRGEEHPKDTVALFLHGWGSRGAHFARLLDTVGEKYFTLAPDLPGFGGSQEPDSAWSVDDFCAYILRFLEHWQPKKVILVGHSFGGRMAIKLGARKDLPFALEQMVLFDAAGVPPKRGFAYHWKVKTYKLGKWFYSLKPIRALFPDALDELRSTHGSADYKQASPIMRACMVKAVNEDLRSYLPQISASVLLIWGENDTATPLSDAKLMEKTIPDAGLVVLPGATHFSFIDDPFTCDRVIRSFLKIGA